MSVDQLNHPVTQLAARIAAYGTGIDAQEAKAAACAVDFLRRSGSRLPVTTEEAAGLDPRVRQAGRVLCATWRKCAVGKCLSRCEQAIRALEFGPSGCLLHQARCVASRGRSHLRLVANGAARHVHQT